MKLPIYQKISNKMKACKETQAQAGYMAEILMHKCVSENISFAFDGCLAGLDWHRHLFTYLRQQGRSIGIVFVCTSETQCLKRVRKRETETGRPVPEHIVVQ